MIGYLLAYGPMWLVIFGISFLVAAVFVHNVLRGFRTGQLYTYRGHVVRERHPIGFRIWVVIYAVSIVVIAGLPFYIVWKHSLGN